MVKINFGEVSSKKAPDASDFRTMLLKMFDESEEREKESVIIEAGELHRRVGWYPGRNHRMPICCSVMRSEMKLLDKILSAPAKGNGASLKIEYMLPR